MRDNTSWRIGFIGFASAMGGLLFGFETAVISGAIELVRVQFNLNTAMEGWFVSSGLLGCIIGVFVAGLLSDRIGRKNVLLFAGLLFLICSVGCGIAISTKSLIGYRFIGGVGVGIASVVSPMYITEFAPPRIRGRMVASYQLAITIGILLAYFSNAWLLSLSDTIQTDNAWLSWVFQHEVWRGMFLVMALPSLLFIVLIILVPESPRWLILKGKYSKARSILMTIQEKNIAEQQFEVIKKRSSLRKTSQRSIWSSSLRTPLLIGIMLCVFQQFSGINAIIYYGPKIFKEAGFAADGALYSQVIIGVVNVVFTLVAITQSDKFGRKPLLMVGLIGMIFSLLMVGLCFYTDNTQGLFLLGLLVVFIACFALSVGPVTWIIINEIFPDDVRTKAVSICTFSLWVAVGIVGQFFPWLLERVGPSGVFWIFAGFSAINLLLCRKMIVETKGKTLEEIEEVYVAPH
ncbi:MAG TPA: sugar porter family MFS transporter [Sphingobacterium sp.]|nr:sugar porter family MFS transporter [Sphingobacterium sp.]